MTGDPAPASYPEIADPNKETYRARYQKWATDLGPEECDRIVISQGGKAWKDYPLKEKEPWFMKPLKCDEGCDGMRCIDCKHNPAGRRKRKFDRFRKQSE